MATGTATETEKATTTGMMMATETRMATTPLRLQPTLGPPKAGALTSPVKC
jgi:hypothetical protein